jgi:hypothetical protein
MGSTSPYDSRQCLSLLVVKSNRLQLRTTGRVNGTCIEGKRGKKGCTVGKAYSTIMSSNRVIEAFGTSITSSSITESESWKKKSRRFAPEGRAWPTRRRGQRKEIILVTLMPTARSAHLSCQASLRCQGKPSGGSRRLHSFRRSSDLYPANS